MARLQLDVIEGPSAGSTVALDGPTVIGRGDDADVVLSDERASRHHARVTPSGSGAVVEDLDSTNGTFVNRAEVHGPAALGAGDELLVGATVFAVRDAEARAERSAVRAVPPALAAAPRQPTYVPAGGAAAGTGPEVPELERLVDSRVKSQAKLAPLAIFALVVLAVLVYLAV
jgi:pSer/pThr/pTyr-binding forkhead associated (FHA) protein